MLFQDFFHQDLSQPDDEDEDSAGDGIDEPRVASLLFRVDETTSSRSQFLAHFSFTPTDSKDTGVQLRGGVPMETVVSEEEEEEEEGTEGEKEEEKMADEAGRT